MLFDYIRRGKSRIGLFGLIRDGHRRPLSRTTGQLRRPTFRQVKPLSSRAETLRRFHSSEDLRSVNSG